MHAAVSNRSTADRNRLTPTVTPVCACPSDVQSTTRFSTNPEAYLDIDGISMFLNQGRNGSSITHEFFFHGHDIICAKTRQCKMVQTENSGFGLTYIQFARAASFLSTSMSGSCMTSVGKSRLFPYLILSAGVVQSRRWSEILLDQSDHSVDAA